MKKFTIQSILLIIAIAVGIFFFSPNSKNIDIPYFPKSPIFNELLINDGKLKVEVAETVSKRNKGLGGRDSLGQNEGMLFIFPKSDKYAFWMKGVKFPLDFVWIKGSKVVDILPNIQPPQPNQKDSSLPIYLPNEEIDKVLEINAGTAQKLNIKAGDIIKLKQI